MKQSKAKIGGGYFKDNKSPSIKITTTLTLKEIKNFLVLCCYDFVFFLPRPLVCCSEIVSRVWCQIDLHVSVK